MQAATKLTLTLLLATMALGAGSAWAQVGPGGAINPERDCQTVRTCRFAKGGSFRGCLSSYSCRICRLVASSCTVTGRERTCRQLRCTWG